MGYSHGGKQTLDISTHFLATRCANKGSSCCHNATILSTHTNKPTKKWGWHLKGVVLGRCQPDTANIKHKRENCRAGQQLHTCIGGVLRPQNHNREIPRVVIVRHRIDARYCAG